jgi:hypothetical protein
MKHVLAVALLCLFAAPSAPAQAPSTQHLTEMKKLDFMIGHWVGEASYLTGPTQRQTFSMDEVVSAKLGGSLLAVEGIGKTKPADGSQPRVIHNALGVLFYDAAANRFTMRAYKSNGLFVDVEPKVGDRVVEWSFTDPRLGQVHYTMKLTERGEWYEVGESSRDGATWSRFFEATLRKVE